MALWYKPPAAGDPSTLEIREQHISLIFSSVAVILMVLGVVWFYLQGGSWQIPSHHAGAVTTLLDSDPLDLIFMSLGILLLGILPIGRVALALWFYGRKKLFGEALVALVVLTELCLSWFWGGGR
jgi:hypothetical protein